LMRGVREVFMNGGKGHEKAGGMIIDPCGEYQAGSLGKSGRMQQQFDRENETSHLFFGPVLLSLSCPVPFPLS
jgi:hypothetical protein